MPTIKKNTKISLVSKKHLQVQVTAPVWSPGLWFLWRVLLHCCRPAWDDSCACHEVRPVPSSSVEPVWFHTGSESSQPSYRHISVSSSLRQKSCISQTSSICCRSISCFTSYLIDSFHPFRGQFLGDSDGSFRVQTNSWHQRHSIISQLKTQTNTLIKPCYVTIQHHHHHHHDDDDVPFYVSKFYREARQQYLIKLLMWLAESRAVPSDTEEKKRKGEKDRMNRVSCGKSAVNNRKMCLHPLWPTGVKQQRCIKSNIFIWFTFVPLN